jgi:protein SCO1/2
MMIRRTLAYVAAILVMMTTVPGATLAAKAPEIVAPAKTLPVFGLADHKGVPFANERLAGKWSLILLGFTQCPDVCPYTLQNLALVVEQLSVRVSPERLPQIVFVGVDPERDRPVLNDYITAFAPGFVGISGARENIQPLIDGVGGFVRFGTKKPDGDYQVQHSAFVAVIDPQGRLAARLNPPMEPASTAAFLAGLMLQYARESK